MLFAKINASEPFNENIPVQLQKFVVRAEACVLRPMLFDDWPAIFQIYNDPESMKFLGACDGKIYDESYSKEFVAALVSKNFEIPLTELTLTIVQQGVAVGYILISNLSGEKKSEIACGIVPLKQRKGIASSLFSAISLIEDLEIKNIDALVHPENIASKRVLEKIGFSYKTTEYIKECDSLMNRYTLKILDVVSQFE